MNGKKARALRRALGITRDTDRALQHVQMVEEISTTTGRPVQRAIKTATNTGRRGQYQAAKRRGLVDVVIQGTN